MMKVNAFFSPLRASSDNRLFWPLLSSESLRVRSSSDKMSVFFYRQGKKKNIYLTPR